MQSIRAYFDNLDEAGPKDQSEFERFQARRRRLFAELVQCIGTQMRHQVDKMDLIEGSYYLSGWQEDEALNRNNARLLADILSGRRLIMTSTLYAQSMDNSPYPPPP